MTYENKVLKAIEKMTDEQFRDFCYEYFGDEYLFDCLQDSINEPANAKQAWELVKTIMQKPKVGKKVCGDCGRSATVSIGKNMNRCERCANL